MNMTVFTGTSSTNLQFDAAIPVGHNTVLKKFDIDTGSGVM